jgi:hypothetical protein
MRTEKKLTGTREISMVQHKEDGMDIITIVLARSSNDRLKLLFGK